MRRRRILSLIKELFNLISVRALSYGWRLGAKQDKKIDLRQDTTVGDLQGCIHCSLPLLLEKLCRTCSSKRTCNRRIGSSKLKNTTEQVVAT